MKKLIFISGIISANLMMFGSIFKVMHWPLASVLLVCAVFIFCFIFLPLALISSYKSESMQKYKLLSLVTFVVFFSGVISILLKIQHWPYANIIMYITLPLPFILFMPVYFYETRLEKNQSDNIMAVMMGLTFLAVFSVFLTMH
jgi:uncharacterized membrane protein